MNIEKNKSLKNYHTFRTEVETSFFFKLERKEDLTLFFEDNDISTSFLLLGEGSNVLFTKKFEGYILYMAAKGLEVLYEDENVCRIKVNAGENWDDFVKYCVENNLYGAENLSLIPGTAGAAPVQNIGAYGAEVKNLIVSTEVFDVKEKIFKEIDNQHCAFEYRSSIFKYPENKKRYIITSVLFELSKKRSFNLEYGALKNFAAERKHINLEDVRDEVIRIRKSKLPVPEEVPNAGSFFKNPVVSERSFQNLSAAYPELKGFPLSAEEKEYKLAAGQLIDLCGLKAYEYKGAAVHDKQALVIVNKNNASGQAILELSEYVKKQVFNKFGVKLVREVNIY